MVLAADKALETAIEQALAAGEPVDRSTGDPEADDPAGGASWGAERTVSADFLIRLLTGVRGPKPAAARSLKLQGVKITGRLNLEAASLVCPVSLTTCYFDAPINLSEARAPAIRLPGCHVSVLDASQLETQGNLSLSGLNATGYISLQGAHIGGSLDLSAATLASLVSPGRVLDAGSITVEQHMFCTGGFTAKGLVALQVDHIRGSLLFSDATLSSPDPSGMVLNGASMTVDQDVFCTGDFTADGTINLMGANIGMELDLHGATLTKPAASETALNAESLTVGQRILCTEGFRANGLIDLQGAHVKGSVHLGDATLTGPGSSGLVLHAASMTVDQDMNCNGRFQAEGTVNLQGARVGGSLIFDGASLKAATTPGTALSAPSLAVGQDMFCANQFQAEGTVNLQGAHIKGSLTFDGATLQAGGEESTALNARSLTVDQDLRCGSGFKASGVIVLCDAHSSHFYDDKDSWPSSVQLEGFTYETLRAEPEVKPRERIRWLRRDGTGYRPHSYEQLGAAYRRAGYDDHSRRVAIAKQWHRRKAVNPLGKLWNWLLYLIVGYGYRTWLAGIWLLVLIVVGERAFAHASADRLLVAAKDNPAQQPAFHAAVYALDLLLPIVSLGPDSAWIPFGWARWWVWGFVLAGWILTTAVVAGLSGLLKRD